MNLSELRPAEGSKHSDTSEEAVDMVQETVRRLVKVIKARKLVPELRDQALKVARCHYTEDYLREVSQIEIP